MGITLTSLSWIYSSTTSVRAYIDMRTKWQYYSELVCENLYGKNIPHATLDRRRGGLLNQADRNNLITKIAAKHTQHWPTKKPCKMVMKLHQRTKVKDHYNKSSTRDGGTTPEKVAKVKAAMQQ